MGSLNPAGLNEKKIFYELDFLAEDPAIVLAVEACVNAQKKASEEVLGRVFKPHPEAAYDVSPAALEVIMGSGKKINSIRTEKEISNVVIFEDKRYENSIFHQDLAAARKQVDRLVIERVKGIFKRRHGLDVCNSGFFLYPRQGYMGWHTNWQHPGWRLYISYAEEPGKSFLRYRDPDSGEIITSMDGRINVRLFRVSLQKPFWHTIYSDTNHYSLGYRIAKVQSKWLKHVKRLFGRRGTPTARLWGVTLFQL